MCCAGRFPAVWRVLHRLTQLADERLTASLAKVYYCIISSSTYGSAQAEDRSCEKRISVGSTLFKTKSARFETARYSRGEKIW